MNWDDFEDEKQNLFHRIEMFLLYGPPDLWRKARWPRCFIKGHDIDYPDEPYQHLESPICSHCCYRIGEDLDIEDKPFTMPDLAGRLYRWMVLRQWRWFGCLDKKITTRWQHKLPDWWEV